jgi:superfamily I DNA/RNA helicase
VLCGFLDDQPPEQSFVGRSLIYVGMTRATRELAFSATSKHRYLADLERGCGRAAAHAVPVNGSSAKPQVLAL